MDKCGYEFVIMMKGMKKLVKSFVLEVKGTFEEDRRYSIRDYKVSGITVKRQLYPSAEKFMYGREWHEVINEEKRLCGYFVIITSEKMTAAQALDLYKGRDVSEKLFRGEKF